MSDLDAYLKELLVEASVELPLVTTRRMFGCDAFFANSNIYALVWHSRLVLKLPDAAKFEAALAMPSAVRWSPMPDKERAMSHWVVMAESFHDDADSLRAWVEHAHRLAMLKPAKPKRAPKPAKRVAAKPTRARAAKKRWS